MPPLPKKKHSSKRKGGRNAHRAIKPASLSTCPQCHSPRMPHRACSECGTYNGRSVIETAQETL
ncbi:MAG: 50S ribosomal protein L32 [Chloroflexota bacterium]|jgi:large subunit ribosomal protein L32|nr:50S ribosomal protein L32 [Chloroflexota bacterium]MQF66562.1 50S ribosomal protein L32 [SAR202 cluster bacterium AC-647-P02_OGT_505m]MQG00801.1 50S ribosomal protein L32 [SAR202 cluster bacterium]MBE41993.1 50S ribosomal protein L32 [Chloroflexota bacterium]MEC7884364.1 50S ribosomal protein L32 [Chloroflexota bacterium]